MHCQATRGRSYMVLACYLIWSKEFPDVMLAFSKICAITQQKVELLPSQIRYMNYVKELIDQPLPKTRKIKIQKIILDGIPQIETEGTAIRPYIQIFKGSELVYTSCTKELPPVSYYATDISISFDLQLEIDGDILIRCRHLGKDHKPLTIFRAMFHTAFTKELVIRFTKNELDGAFNDDRFPPEFTVDLFLSQNQEIEESELQRTFCICQKKKEENDEEEKKLDKGNKKNNERNDSDEELDDYIKKLESK